MHGGRVLTRARAALAAAIALVVVAAVGWWSAHRGPDVAPAPQAVTAACAKAAAAYPASLGRLARGDLDVTAAATYGDPAVVVRCGMPPLGPTSDECVDISGIDWVVHPLSDGTRLTTYGRSPAIEVLVPSAHSPAPMLVPALHDAAAALPATGHRCIG